MSNSIPTDVVLKVFGTLDYLKLCVDHNKPLGNGISVDIVVMPDLVVDVDGASIEKLNDSKHPELNSNLTAAEIGSRCGRVLSILAHLRDQDDESFQLDYIAKTGHGGRAKLKGRLHDNLKRNFLQSLEFPYLIPSELTRYTVYGRKNYDTIANRQVLRPKDKDILTFDELTRHFYSPVDKIRNARSVYFATDSLLQFNELIDLVVLGKSINNKDKNNIQKL
jgi:hypothetical protein